MARTIPRPVISHANLRSIRQVLIDAIEHVCSCRKDGNGYLGHRQSCGVHASRQHYSRVSRFIAEQFQDRELNGMQYLNELMNASEETL